MIERDTPIVHQFRVRTGLRKLREDAALTRSAVAEELEWSVSKILRIEHGSTNVSITDLRALLKLYRVGDEARERELLDSARASRKSAWWTFYRPHIDPQLYFFLGYEASSSKICQFQSSTIPGLLQTRRYTEALSRAWGNDPEAVERGARIRAHRQEIVHPGGPVLQFYLDEAVLRRQVGTAEDMVAQLRKVLEVARFDNVTIRVVPFSSGEHPGMRGPFSLLYVSESPDEFIVVLELPLRDVLIKNDQAESKQYLTSFDGLVKVALSKRESEKRILEIIETFEQ